MPRAAIAAVKRRDPVARVGAAVCLGFMALGIAGGWLWWRATSEPRVHLTLFFPGTVHGVDVGSPVKILGVPVGQIESLGVRLPAGADPAHYAAVNVVLDGDLLSEKGLPRRLDRADVLREEILRGLRARLRLISPMHGTRYLELSYDATAPARFVAAAQENLAEVPTLPDPLTDGLIAATHAFAELERRDFDADQAELLERLDRLAADLDPEVFRKANDAALAKLDAVNAALSNPKLRERLAAVNADLVALRRHLAEYDGKSESGSRELLEAAGRLRADLAKTTEETGQIGRALDPRSPVFFAVYARLSQVRDNATRVQALCRQLVDAGSLAAAFLGSAASGDEDAGKPGAAPTPE